MAHGHSIDEYLETIYFLAFPIGEYRPAVTGSPTLSARVAEMLGVSRASAGEMLKRLEAEGLVERGEHREAILTAAGRERAEKVVRRHRLIERWLTDFLGYTPSESHVQADLLGDTFTDEMIDRMDERLGHPDRCPHGWPLDTEAEQAENRELHPLADARGRASARRSSASPSTTASCSTGSTTRGSSPAPRSRSGRSARTSACAWTAPSARSARGPRPASTSGRPPDGRARGRPPRGRRSTVDRRALAVPRACDESAERRSCHTGDMNSHRLAVFAVCRESQSVERLVAACT